MKTKSFSTSPESPKDGKNRPRRSRVSAVLLIIAVLITLVAFLTPHVIFRVPLAVVTIFGLWRARKWSYPMLWISGAIWLLFFVTIVPFLFVAPPWELWFMWLYWLIPTTLVITACILMTTAEGKAERAKWVRGE